MSGGGTVGKGAAAPVPAASRKLVQSLKEIVNRPEAEIYAALRECGMDPDEAVSRLLSQDTFQEVKSKRDKKKEIKEIPEPRSRSANNSTSRGARGGADRGARNSSVHSSSIDNAASKSSVSGPGMPSTNSNQKQTIPSSSANKHIADGPAVPLQSSSGFQQGWSGTPGQLSMADIVKMGRPQAKHSSKPVVTADRGYAGQYPSLPNTLSQNPKQSASTASPTELDQGLPPVQDSVQVKNYSHSAADNKHTYGNDWSSQDEPPSVNQSSFPETSGDPYEALLQSSTLVDCVVHSHENSHLDENDTSAVRPVTASERHLEHDKVEDSNADVSAAAANFQSLSLHNEELAANNFAEDNPAVIIPDHLQVTNTECASLSFGSFESGAFSGFLPQKTTDSNAELPVGGESAPVDQIDARNQDYYDTGAVNSSANENLEALMGATMENVDAPSVSQADVLRQEVLDPSGLQYDLSSASSHAYSNTNTSQPSAMEDPQGNNQAHTLSHLSNLMQANPLSTSLLGSNQSTLHDLEFSLPPYLAAKYNTGSTTNPRPAISMQEALKTGVFSNTQSTQNLPNTSIATGPPLPQQLAAHPYSQPTVPLTPFANIIGYPYLAQNYAAYLPSAAFQQAYPSNGPFHQSAAAVPGSGMKYSIPEYKNNLSATGLQQQPSSVMSGYGGFGSSSNLPANFTLNQSTGSASTPLGFDEALSRQYKDTSQYMALQQGDNSAMWLHGSGSRAASALPPSHFYGYQGQSQQGGFRQAQQPQPSQFGGHGYPTFYSSQGGLTQEHPQNLADGSLNGFQTAPSQPSHPSWQHQNTY
ncbi:GBF-interacting protein 1-like isoform X2 [Phragmites australis]|uniref:GBF-interacting protein 1-like isoform X2 n=1 Tax=Phragmites australis TaxID=29695 RepID=UPI002D782531|nr:GBF-interacting protein 1-like isoform X2 [Phragmites australis]